MQKKNLYAIVYLIIIFLGGLIVIILDSKRKSKYWDHQDRMTLNKSYELYVEETRYLRGLLSFNGAFYVDDVQIRSSNIELIDVTDLQLPFWVCKKRQSDTLEIKIKQGETYFFVLEEI